MSPAGSVGAGAIIVSLSKDTGFVGEIANVTMASARRRRKSRTKGLQTFLCAIDAL